MRRRTKFEWSPINDEAKVVKRLLPEVREIEVTVGPETAHGLRADQYLAQALRSYSRTLLKRWCDAGYVFVGNRAIKASFRPDASEVFFLSIPHPKSLVTPPPLQILYEDDKIIVANKSPGQLPHPAGRTMTGTLLNQLQDHIAQQGGDTLEVRLVNRIDRDTSGIVLGSKNADAHRVLCEFLQAHRFDKRYQALCHGVPAEAHGHWTDRIADPADNDETIARHIGPEGRDSHTEYQVRDSCTTSDGQQFSILDITLHTGRQHQIRIHAAHNGHPLIGDWVYGAPCEELEAQALHAFRLTFPHPDDERLIKVEAPLIGSLAELWQGLRQDQISIHPRPLKRSERSRLGMSLDESQSPLLPEGWHRPSWMSEDELAALVDEIEAADDEDHL